MEQQFFTSSVNLRFYLRKATKGKPSSIILKVRYDGITTKHICKGIKVYPNQWNQKKQKAYVCDILSPCDNWNNEIVNTEIDNLRQKVENYINGASFSHKKSISFHHELKTILGMRKRQKEATQNIDIDIYKLLWRQVINDETIKNSTRKNYERGIKTFQEFSSWRATQGDEEIKEFKQITCSVIDEYSAYLRNEAKGSKGEDYSVPTINGKLKYFLSAFHKYAHKTKLIQKEETKIVGYEQLSDKGNPSHIALRDDELFDLWNYKCKDKADERIRDMFLILCTTGQRVGDINKIAPSHETVNGIDKISFVQEKTQNLISVPFVFKLAKEIFDKYNGAIPKIDAKSINENIGRIAKEANVGTKETVKVTRHYGGEAEVRSEDKRRYECIKTHTGRRTFCTLLAHRGWTFEKIKEFSGHKKAGTIERNYCKMDAMSQQLFAKLRREHPDRILPMTIDFESDSTLRAIDDIPQPRINGNVLQVASIQHTSLPSTTDEAKRVLNFLGCDADEYMECGDYDSLLRLVCRYEDRIVSSHKGDIDEIKEIFNDSADIRARKARLLQYIQGLKGE